MYVPKCRAMLLVMGFGKPSHGHNDVCCSQKYNATASEFEAWDRGLESSHLGAALTLFLSLAFRYQEAQSERGMRPRAMSYRKSTGSPIFSEGFRGPGSRRPGCCPISSFLWCV